MANIFLLKALEGITKGVVTGLERRRILEKEDAQVVLREEENRLRREDRRSRDEQASEFKERQIAIQEKQFGIRAKTAKRAEEKSFTTDLRNLENSQRKDQKDLRTIRTRMGKLERIKKIGVFGKDKTEELKNLRNDAIGLNETISSRQTRITDLKTGQEPSVSAVSPKVTSFIPNLRALPTEDTVRFKLKEFVERNQNLSPEEIKQLLQAAREQIELINSGQPEE